MNFKERTHLIIPLTFFLCIDKYFLLMSDVFIHPGFYEHFGRHIHELWSSRVGPNVEKHRANTGQLMSYSAMSSAKCFSTSTDYTAGEN